MFRISMSSTKLPQWLCNSHPIPLATTADKAALLTSSNSQFLRFPTGQPDVNDSSESELYESDRFLHLSLLTNLMPKPNKSRLLRPTTYILF